MENCDCRGFGSISIIIVELESLNECKMPESSPTKVLIGRIQSLDWTGGLDWWTVIKPHNFFFNGIAR